ncbi:MAG: hypothetical protein ACOZAO_00880 [Patescibacteria group bacterium]
MAKYVPTPSWFNKKQAFIVQTANGTVYKINYLGDGFYEFKALTPLKDARAPKMCQIIGAGTVAYAKNDLQKKNPILTTVAKTGPCLGLTLFVKDGTRKDSTWATSPIVTIAQGKNTMGKPLPNKS